MPSLVWSQLIAAGATFNPLDGWQYEYMPVGAVIKIVHRATAIGLLTTVTSGSDTLMEEAPVPAGGTAGQTPAEITVEPLVDEVAAGDRIKIKYRNPTGGAITVDGIIKF